MLAERLPDLDVRLESMLLSPRRLAARVRSLGARIAADTRGVESLCIVGVLKGACVFMADLGRSIRRADGPPVEYGFIRTRTYGSDIKNAGETERMVRVDWMGQALRGRDVLLVDDILDQGFTLKALRRILVEEHAVASLRMCVLLSKRLEAPTPAVACIREQLQPEYVGFEIPDRWVAGYGLDVNEEFRDLPYVALVKEECF